MRRNLLFACLSPVCAIDYRKPISCDAGASRGTSLETARGSFHARAVPKTKRPQMSVAFWLVQRNSLASSSDAQTPSEIRNRASAQEERDHGRILRCALQLVNPGASATLRRHRSLLHWRPNTTFGSRSHVPSRKVRIRSSAKPLFRSRLQGRARRAKMMERNFHPRPSGAFQLQRPALPGIRRIRRQQRPAEAGTGQGRV